MMSKRSIEARAKKGFFPKACFGMKVEKGGKRTQYGTPITKKFNH